MKNPVRFTSQLAPAIVLVLLAAACVTIDDRETLVEGEGSPIPIPTSTGGTDGNPPCECGTALIGDPCSVDEDCAEGFCNGAWCTQTCTTNTDCFGDNWCLANNAGLQTCFPGCALDSSECLAYPGTTCQEGSTVDDYSMFVCSL